LICTLSLLALSPLAMGQQAGMTDQQAGELGMVPASEHRGNVLLEGLREQWRRAVNGTISKQDQAAEADKDALKAQVVLIVNKAQKGTAKSAQTLRVYYKGDLLHTFIVSTGKETKVKATSGKEYIATTPTGYYRPTTIWKEYQSSTWVGASMNFPVFFINGIAVHSTTPDHFKELGQRDSGGCVRLHPDNAKIVNELVLTTGLDSFEIKNRGFTVSGKKLTRNQVVGGEVSVTAVDRKSGELKKNLVKSWDTLIVVKDLRD